MSAKRLRWPRPICLLVADDSDDVVRVLLREVRVGVVQRAPHLVGMLLVDAEHDRLGPAVGAPEVLSQVLGRGLGAGEQRNDALEIIRRVQAVGDLLAEEVELPLIRRPTVSVRAQHDAADTVRGEEAVVDALSERVLEQRAAAEVVVGVGGLVALRRRGHAELRRRREVVEDRAPRRLGSGASPVALVDDDEVEEVRGELPKHAVEVRTAVRELLVEAEVDLPASLGFAVKLPDR